MSIRVLIHRDETVRKVPTLPIKKAVQRIAQDYGWEQGEISIALVSNAEIHVVNRNHLSHDYPTDVISFDLTEDEDWLEGEIIASVEMADTTAGEHGWTGDKELLLYIVHGMLHIIGLNDKKPSDIKLMRAEEKYYLSEILD